MVKAAEGHDLEEEKLGNVEVEGWEGFPTTLFRYAKTDADGTKKTGLIVLLNPDARQAARWIVQAVIDTTGSYDPEKAKRLARETAGASGFQFPVRGVHWEDMGRKGVHTAYPFRDGVTVKLRAFGESYPSTVLDESQLKYTVEADVTLTGKYARIQSTTREQYMAAGGQLPVDGHLWRSVVRKLYQAAWGKDRNELMTAKAKVLFKTPAK